MHREEDRHSAHLFRRHEQTACTYSYVVTKQGARSLSEKVARDGCPFAVDDKRLYERANFTELMCSPMLCSSPIGYKSDIQPWLRPLR